MKTVYSLIQDLNDKSLDLQVLLTELDEALANTVEIETVYESEEGREYGTMRVLDEDAITELLVIYKKLEQVIGGKYEV